jgi:putative inorganic carbon (HCO3(-)) transporter
MIQEKSEVGLAPYTITEPGLLITEQTTEQTRWNPRYLLRRAVDGLLWIEPVWLALLAPSILVREYLWDAWVQPWLVAALFLFWPLRLLVHRRLARATPLTAPLLVLLGCGLVAVWPSAYPERSWEAFGFLAFGVALAIAALNWRPAQHHPWLVVIPLAAVGLALAVIGPALLLSLPEEFMSFSEELAQTQATQILGMNETINPNILAGALLLPLPVLLGLAVGGKWSKQWWPPVLIGLLTVPIAWALVIAQSRGVYLAAALSVILVLTLRWPWSGVAFGLAAVAAGSVLSQSGLYGIFEAVGSEGALTSLTGRWEVWERSLYAIRDFPLSGIGMGAFDLVIPYLYPYNEITNGAGVPHAHNLFLQVGVDLGLPGLLAYGWLWVAAVRVLITQLRAEETNTEQSYEFGERGDEPRSRSPRRRSSRSHRHAARRKLALRRALALGAAGGLAALFFHGLVDAATWGTKVAFLPWLILGLIGLLHYQTQLAADPLGLERAGAPPEDRIDDHDD